MNALTHLWRRNPPACAALLIALVVALRIVIVIIAPPEVGPDEAQYWRWSEKLDFGYYSKPPLVAWVIAASTALFGDGEWAIRLSAPMLHGAAAFFLFLLGKLSCLFCLDLSKRFSVRWSWRVLFGPAELNGRLLLLLL